MSAIITDATEALANACVGFAVSWGATLWLLPFWGLTPSPSAAFGITAMFFAISTARAFVLRRLFRRLAQ